MVKAHAGDPGWDRLQLWVINMDGYASSVSLLSELTDLPVLQDDATVDAETQYGAGNWYIYLADGAGQLRDIHYYVPIPGDGEEVLVAEIQALLDEGGR